MVQRHPTGIGNLAKVIETDSVLETDPLEWLARNICPEYLLTEWIHNILPVGSGCNRPGNGPPDGKPDVLHLSNFARFLQAQKNVMYFMKHKKSPAKPGF
jgi:hypothetical protein